jgi:NADPH-dependent F420 reductase
MRIGIIGAGNIGGNFGRRWAAKGHEIRFGVREPAKIKALVDDCGGRTQATDVHTATQASEVVLLALPWNAVAAVLKEAGDLRGKILVDATNALKWNDGPEPAITDTSAAQKIAEMAPGARVVKAFNTLGAEHVLAPVVGGQPADVYLCTDDAGARDTVKQLAEQIDFHVVDAGPLRNARLTEHLALLWIYLAMKGGLSRNIAFKVLGGS